MTPTVDLIAEARLEGAQMEWERHDRERRVLLGQVAIVCDSVMAAIQHHNQAARSIEAAVIGLAALREHVAAGDWIKSPQQMAADRAAANEGKAA